MEATNNWYEGIEREIGSLKEKVSKEESKLYELDLLQRVAKRVGGFSSDCEYCQGHRNDISKLITDLGNLPKITQEEVADYGRKFRSIIKHLEKHHLLYRIVPTAPYILIPLGIAVLLFIIGGVMLSSDEATRNFDLSGLVWWFFGAIIGLVGVVLGIISLFRKPI
ncbi:hypothetical protein ACFLUX_02160 [Chloroflexota bacterium]